MKYQRRLKFTYMIHTFFANAATHTECKYFRRWTSRGFVLEILTLYVNANMNGIYFSYSHCIGTSYFTYRWNQVKYIKTCSPKSILSET